MKKNDTEIAVQHSRTGYLQQDLGMLVFILTIFIGIVLMTYAPSELKLEFICMLLISFLGVLFAAYRFTILSVVCSGLQITIFAAYKLFSYYVYSDNIQIVEFIWLFYPLLAVGSMSLFINRSFHIEKINRVLRNQIDRLVLVDSLTGLYNLKCLYLDLETQTALAARRKAEISLMIVAFRYEGELRKILGKHNFDILKQEVATIVRDCIRIEDKLYAINEKGELAVILNCNSEGSEIVKARIRNALSDIDKQPEIIHNRIIKLDMQIAVVQYNPEVYGKDVMKFKAVVESELQYDV